MASSSTRFTSFFRWLLKEDFSWSQFSKDTTAADDDDPVMRTLNKIQSDPEAMKAIQSSGKGKEKSNQIQQVLDANKELLQAKKGINVGALKQLGAGSQGTAFDLGNKRVLKVTGDANEARASTALIGKVVPGVTAIFDTWKFPNSNLYGIVLEKVLTFNQWPEDAWKNAVEEVVDVFNLKSMLQKHKGNWEAIWQEIASDPVMPQDQKPTMKKVLDSFQAATQGLASVGITNFFDLHLDNIGKRADGNMVIFDIGFAQGGADPQTLQEFYLESIIEWL